MLVGLEIVCRVTVQSSFIAGHGLTSTRTHHSRIKVVMLSVVQCYESFQRLEAQCLTLNVLI
jgi:hypothetical protein